MTDKELRHLSRAELLQMLLDKTRETDRLRRQLEQTEAELSKARAKVESREIILEEAGSIAEASLKLGGVFDAAQKAADLYLENVRRDCGAAPKEPNP